MMKSNRLREANLPMRKSLNLHERKEFLSVRGGKSMENEFGIRL